MRKILLISFILTAFLVISLPAMCSDYTIIANSSVTEQKLSKQTLQDIFLGNIANWQNGDRILLATIRSGKANDAFLKDIIGRTRSQYNTYWKQIIFTGKGTPPQIFTSDSDIIDYVASNRGAIGYISSEPEEEIENIKIIKVE